MGSRAREGVEHRPPGKGQAHGDDLEEGFPKEAAPGLRLRDWEGSASEAVGGARLAGQVRGVQPGLCKGPAGSLAF